MTIGAVCNREVVVVTPEESVIKAAELMRELDVGDVVVAKEDGDYRVPVGIVTDRDITVEIVAEQVDPNSVTIGDIMSYELVTAREEDDIITVIAQMREKRVRRVPVVGEDNQLLGIVTMDDLVDLLAELLTDLVKLVGAQRRPAKPI